MGSQRFCLRWNNHQSNLLSVFDQLLHDEAFVDVTLAVEGQLLKAHKMVLSACSPYFQALFVGHPDKHPIVILKDVPYSDMRSLLDFMYRGEVSVAESLRIKGLTEVNEERCDLPSIANSLLMNQNTPPPQSPAQQHHIQQQLLTSNQQQQQLVPVSQQQQPSPQQSQLVGGGKSPQQHPPPPPNLHRCVCFIIKPYNHLREE
ncbi:hypothetical protein AAG570_000883 [Ranatra chinensis]|uniref:BTB domain-containing protein n=1 Tax=Ranatra chinensis TaxID=642074 RepID=A0ABD0YYE5_9HEMI